MLSHLIVVCLPILAMYAGLSTSLSPLPYLTISNLSIPDTPLIVSALSYAKENVNLATLNHVIRSTYFTLLLRQKIPYFANSTEVEDDELIVIACILHDLGWAITPGLRSENKRFEVDSADLAKAFVVSHVNITSKKTKYGDSEWNKHRLELLWNSVALHTSRSINQYAHPTIALISQGILADFTGPNYSWAGQGGYVTVDEYKEIATVFAREEFKDAFVDIMCSLCREKKQTVWDNFVGDFGREFGLDGKGTGKEEFSKEWEANRTWRRQLGGLDCLPEVV